MALDDVQQYLHHDCIEITGVLLCGDSGVCYRRAIGSMSSQGGRGGGRDRDKNHKYESGAAKRKAKLERVVQESKVLSKVPKISTLFFPKTSGGNIGDNATGCSAQALRNPVESAVNNTATIATIVTDSVPEQSDETLTITSDLSGDPSTDAYSCDLGMWPPYVSDSMRKYWVAKGSSECRNLDADFSPSSSKFEGDNYKRQCQKSLFTYTHELTKQQHPQSWLCYSPSKHAVFCFACKLMNDSNVFGKLGYKDWKHASNKIPCHEKSALHLEAIIQLLQRSDAGCCVHVELRGLPFRGSNEIVGSPRNGNYLGTLELLAIFDPFLVQHIKRNTNKGRGHTSYLSKTICDEFIYLLANRVHEYIVTEVKSAKYYSVSVDSTPDISHVDQLTCILRYVLPSGPVEQYLTFLQGHTGKELAESLLKFLKAHDIAIADCRGQSYNNASNMSGKYNGMQAIIRHQCNLAEYVHCATHSLNLVGQTAVGCCTLAIGFFRFLQGLYSFFSASPHRWKVLMDQLSSEGLPTVKRMSDTRWSARADAIKALVKGYDEINDALVEIADDEEEKAET
ncbi:zinc finger MYM-type 1-like [Paramuricea clavata]|uniref:Zinc finger MYM-type 1-like n=1 Tax=Paramuricea clavata TaxID=317549 RepID=A0A6S7INC3_PARCT|nr:zinc finger MYM-type 1-like [Paramuricea clavata]